MQVEPSPDHYSPSALVTASGAVQELGGGAGKRILEANPELLACILVVMGTGAHRADFYWQAPDRSWASVTMECDVPPGAPRRATVTIVSEALPFEITARELDVLTLIVEGLSNSEIAARLVTSVRTVATHVEHLLSKTGRANRAALAVAALEHGLVRRPVPGTVTDGPALAAARVPSGGRTRPLERRPFIIGSAFPLQGPAGADGHEMRNGSALAISELNRRGGIAGRPLRQIVLDMDIFSSESVQRAFQQLADAEVDALTSGYLFAEDAACGVASRYGAPYLHAMTSERQAQHVRSQRTGVSHIFQVCPTEIHYGVRFVKFLDELVAAASWDPPNRRLAVIETPVPSGKMLNDLAFRQAEASGWAIERCDLVPAVGADWETLVGGLARFSPAAIMVAHFLPSELAGFQLRFLSNATPSLVYAIYTPSVPQFLELAGPASEGLIWSTVSGTYHDELGLQFANRYAAAYGRIPGGSHAGIAYDEIFLLAQAWAETENPRDFAAVADRLRNSIYRGVNGAYSLRSGDQSALPYPDVTKDPSLGQAHLVLQVQDGAHRILSPEPYAEAEFRLPPWISPS